MAFKKGNKLGGRKPGSKNKVTLEVKEIIKNIVEENLEIIQKDIKNMESDKRIDVVLKLLKYVTPELRATNVRPYEEEEITISFEEPINRIERVIVDPENN